MAAPVSTWVDYVCPFAQIATDSTDCLRSEMVDDVPIRKLFVGNLAERTTFKDVRNCFSKYGNVESCYLHRNRRNQEEMPEYKKSNYAFVTFTKVEDAAKAMLAGRLVWSTARKGRTRIIEGINLHDRWLKVKATDPWHQPDYTEQRLYTMGKDSNKTCERKLNLEQYFHKYLQNDTENVSIHMLNDDCLRHIFLFLPIKERVRIEIVCKRWRDLSQDLWRTMTFNLSSSSSTWNFIYESDPDGFHAFYKILLKYGRFLTRIKVDRMWGCLRPSALTVIGKLCPNLTSIDITSVTVSTPGIRALANNCRHITKLNLGPSTKCCETELKCLFKLNQNLEYLAINGSCDSIFDECLLCLPEQTMHTIILNDCSFSDTHLSMVLKKLENLKHLAINRCKNCCAHTLKVIGQHCKSLRTLELDKSYVETADMLNLIHLVNLQVLKITHNPNVSDDFLTDLVQHCQQLTNVDITGCSNVSDVGLTAIATLVRLEKLNISDMKQITDDGLKNICNLKVFKCRYCLFSDRGMTTLIRSSPELQLLDLSGCRNINNSTIEVAKDVCSSRTNNVMLKMIVMGTAILTKKGRLPRHIVNDLLDDLSGSVSNLCLVDRGIFSSFLDDEV
ncbi:F-box/LRR-repeat protein 7-like [Temnothorax curvispinosus]|uniref:F-box/LRR-repeat protein 7-like n=1 Tax=Temnothorax curvispinosus TaxID=300111 RepID=A0A6J1Q802_9HYME|nr:F-box/LRR-repeat protein 7-like [Temnothorax curvispinosus]